MHLHSLALSLSSVFVLSLSLIHTMASSSQKKVSGNLTGKELVPVKMEIDDQALCLAIEHPPVNISLIKVSVLKRHLICSLSLSVCARAQCMSL